MDRMRRLERGRGLGYAARGLVYCPRLDRAVERPRDVDRRGRGGSGEDCPPRPLLSVLLAAGLFGIRLFKIYAAAIDLDHKGDDPRAVSPASAARSAALAYFGSPGSRLKVLVGDEEGTGRGGPGGIGGARQEAAVGVAQAAGGDWLLILAGAGRDRHRDGQLVHRVERQVHEGNAAAARALPSPPDGSAMPRARWSSGWSVGSCSRPGSTASGCGTSATRWRYCATSMAGCSWRSPAGLMAFGLTSLMMARYRRIEDRDVVDDLERGIDKAAASVKN